MHESSPTATSGVSRQDAYELSACRQQKVILSRSLIVYQTTATFEGYLTRLGERIMCYGGIKWSL